MRWLTEMHRSLLEVGEPELSNENECDPSYNALYLCCKNHLENAGVLERYDNYYSIAQKLNLQIERMKKEMFAKMGDKGCVLMMFIVGALRHCDFTKLNGFEDLKEIDLDSIIERARQEGYLNSWALQGLARKFKFGYWEA